MSLFEYLGRLGVGNGKTGWRILQGAREALAFTKGEADAADYVVHVPSEVDVRAIRKRLGLTQVAFAARYGFSIGRVRDSSAQRRLTLPPHRNLTALAQHGAPHILAIPIPAKRLPP